MMIEKGDFNLNKTSVCNIMYTAGLQICKKMTFYVHPQKIIHIGSCDPKW